MTKILAIDDKADNIVVIKALLKHFMPEVETAAAASGKEGLALARRDPPDVILLDLVMPEMSGYDVCRVLKADPATRHVPVIVLTALKSDAANRIKALDAGADAFLGKPLDEAELAAQIRAMLRIKTAEDRLRREKDDLERLVRRRTRALEDELAERKRLENALAESEALLKAAMDHSQAGIAIADAPDGRLRYVNEAGLAIRGKTKTDVVRGVNILRYPADWQIRHLDGTMYADDDVPLARAVRYGETCTREFIIRREDGENRYVWANAAPVKNDSGDIIAGIVIFLDITDRKIAEIEKEKLEAQLRQTQKMEAIGALAGGIAHDFNNILFPIVGYTEMLADDIPEDSPMQDNVQEILIATKRARDLVEQILAFSRQNDQEIRPIRIQSILKEAIKLSRSTLPSTIEIRQDIDAGADAVLADPTQIHQIIMNLVTNAYHAMEDDGGALTLALKNVNAHAGALPVGLADDGAYVCLTVTDTGAGMDRKTLEKIFDPYFTTKEKGKGTGLGLAVVHGIVNSCGGAVAVQSDPGRGTAFDVYFPTYAQDGEDAEEAAAAPVRTGCERILMVDDEPPIMKLQKQMLERLGYQVTGIANSLEALEVFTADPGAFDLVVTDMTMPMMTGDRLAAELMKMRPELPVLICTGFSHKITPEKAERIGVRGVIKKPVIKTKLSEMVRKALDERRQRHE